MENFENNNDHKKVNLSPEEEFKLEKDIKVNLIEAESALKAREEMEKLVSLERNSKNGRAISKIQDCMDILNLNCSGANIGNEIASSLAIDLYPELYRNIALKRENVEFKDLKKMAISLELLGIDLKEGKIREEKPYDGIDHMNKEMIKDAFIKFVQLLPDDNGER